MFQTFIGRYNCWLGRHQRSRHYAHRVLGTDKFTSVCEFCGVAMQREGDGPWVSLENKQRERERRRREREIRARDRLR